jgi:dynein heavy chain, axonemal
MARSDKTKLWDIPEDDEVYSRVKREVEEIIDINIKNIDKVLEIYNKY